MHYVYDTIAGTMRPAATRFFLDHDNCVVVTRDEVLRLARGWADSTVGMSRKRCDEIARALLASTWTEEELADVDLAPTAEA